MQPTSLSAIPAYRHNTSSSYISLSASLLSTSLVHSVRCHRLWPVCMLGKTKGMQNVPPAEVKRHTKFMIFAWSPLREPEYYQQLLNPRCIWKPSYQPTQTVNFIFTQYHQYLQLQHDFDKFTAVGRWKLAPFVKDGFQFSTW